MKDELLVDFSSEPPDDPEEAEPIPEDEELPKERRYKPNMYKKFLAFRGSTVWLGLSLLGQQLIVAAYLYRYEEPDQMVFFGLVAMFIGTLIVFAYTAIGYVNGQLALDRFATTLKQGMDTATDLKIGRKGEESEVAETSDEDRDLRE